jgi:GGDEF domain-containing protein
MPTTTLAAALVAAMLSTTVVALLLRRCRHQLAHAQHQATTDPLTGLANRRAFTTALHATARHGTPMAVALLDADLSKDDMHRLGSVAG